MRSALLSCASACFLVAFASLSSFVFKAANAASLSFTFALKDGSDLLAELLSHFFVYFLLEFLASISCIW